MTRVISASAVENTSGKELVMEIVTVAVVSVLASVAYALLYNRANVLSHSIGYNLYASERVLEGAVPYRDFHTLYPPAIFWLNALFFKWLGVSLHSALLGVLIFKVLTVVMIYASGRQIMPRTWALAAALASLLWLRPNGPFKAVPMQYGLLLLTLAMYLLLKHQNHRKWILLFLSGASLGLVGLFKHNIGAYALGGSVALLLLEGLSVRQEAAGRVTIRRFGEKLVSAGRHNYRAPFILLTGCAAVILPAMAYMQMKGALAPMIRTLLFGPGEFLLSRLAVPLSPVAPILLMMSIALVAYAAHKVRGGPALVLWLILIAAIALFVCLGREADINQIIFYLPMIVVFGGVVTCVFARWVAPAERRASLMVFVFTAAALMELFPRFAREQSIAAMPLVMLFLICALYLLRPALRTITVGALEYRLALAVLPLTFCLIEARLFVDTYFDRGLRFRASSELSTERGHGVYFPSATAAMIDNSTAYIQNRVPVDGNAFAQSDAGTSLLFLSGRSNVSRAQFWIGVGVTEQERAATLDRIDKSQTKLIITSDEVLAAERYEPMRDYIERHFKPTARFEDVLMLER